MTQNGKIIELKGEYAVAVIKKESSCGENCASCGMCDTSKMRKIEILNECGAAVGEEIEIFLESYKTVILALITYLLPLVIFFTSALFVSHELISALILVIAFVLCAFLANILAKRKSFMSRAKRKELRNDN
ncbi:MAG: SoxR reducing system RseC family protein [Clostridia bacterium]|nr:SoxR reducing system RseC family protein [Clostridia bacterium]